MTEIRIGFTAKPKLFYRKALAEAAKENRIDITLCDLSEEDKVRWEKIDALVLPGGPDIDPCYYMNQVDQSLREHTQKYKNLSHSTKKGKLRDAFEHALLMELFHNRALSRLPVLGICRGMQMLAVSQGIPLYLDLRLETGLIRSKIEYIPVNVIPGTKLHRIIGEDTFSAMKYQHQGIRLPYLLGHKDQWPGIRLSAVSHDDKMAEAIEFLDRPILGVQFHPELSFEAAPRKVFSWLLREAVRRSEERRMIFQQENVY